MKKVLIFIALIVNTSYFINMREYDIFAKKHLLPVVMIGIWMLGGTSADALQATNEAQRQALMNQEMDCINRKFSSGGGVTWESTCFMQNSGTFEIAKSDEAGHYDDTAVIDLADYSVWDDPVDPPELYAQSEGQGDSNRGRQYDEARHISRYDNIPFYDFDDDSFGWLDSSLSTIDIGVDLSSYRYAEPEFMRTKGYMWGIFGVFTFRTSENKHIKSAGDILSDENSINMFRVDAKFSGGDLDYESEGTGKSDDDRHYMFETRGTVGYDIPIRRSSRVTPYVGFGYRYLKDDSGGTTTTTGAAGYDRESFYYYIPLGLETQTKLSKSWLFEMTFEYDFFLWGTQKSHFEDVLSGYNTLYNDQDGGYGARGSFKIINQHDSYSLFFEPFVRYWNIEDSDIDTLTYFGTPVSLGIEPANTTTEYGVKMGMRF